LKKEIEHPKGHNCPEKMHYDNHAGKCVIDDHEDENKQKAIQRRTGN